MPFLKAFETIDIPVWAGNRKDIQQDMKLRKENDDGLLAISLLS